MPTIRIHRLIDHPPATEVVAGWIDSEWGAFSGRSRDETRARFTEDRACPLPCSCVAPDSGHPRAAVSHRAGATVGWIWASRRERHDGGRTGSPGGGPTDKK